MLITGLFLPLTGQRQLLIEKAGNPRPERLQIYDKITFQLRDDPVGWYTRQIFDLDAGGQMILLGDTWTSVRDISRLRLKRQRVIPNIIGGALAGGGASMFLFDLWQTVVGDPRISQGGMEYGAVNMAVGYGLKSWLGPIKYRLGNRKRLRVVDLTIWE